MKRFLRDNGLTLLLLLLFIISMTGQALAGWSVENADLLRHGGNAVPLSTYLSSASFVSAVFENWESEFLQMSAYVVLTAILFQRGSAESNDPDKDPRDARAVASWLYAHSLGIALFALFVASFTLHWLASARVAAQEAVEHGEAPVGAIAYLADAQLWFESFQNWQSEFLSTAVLVVLSIFLRQRNSPESKPLDASNSMTGN